MAINSSYLEYLEYLESTAPTETFNAL